MGYNIDNSSRMMGKSTGRKEHLRANERYFKLLALLCCALPTGIAISLYIREGQAVFIPYPVITSVFYRLNELWNTPDNDLAWKLKMSLRKAYWFVWSKVIRHRGIFSHTIMFGSPVRFCVAYGPSFGAVMYATNFQWFPEWLGWSIIFAFLGAVLSDLVHFVTDEMNLIEFTLTGDP